MNFIPEFIISQKYKFSIAVILKKPMSIYELKNIASEYFGSEDFVEFDSLINIRPWKNNRSRYIEDENVRNKIYGMVKSYFNDAA